jgi:hypothetical protein
LIIGFGTFTKLLFSNTHIYDELVGYLVHIVILLQSDGFVDFEGLIFCFVEIT